MRSALVAATLIALCASVVPVAAAAAAKAPIAKGPVAKGPVAKSLTAKGLKAKGPVAPVTGTKANALKNLAAKGLTAKGRVAKGAAVKSMAAKLASANRPSAVAARAKGVVAKIDVSSQAMHVFVDGQLTYQWPVSTAGKGYRTPRGVFRPQRMALMHYSKKYFNAPMPYSIFISGGYAIHATPHVRQLGRPASHGCVRLHPKAAAELYALVQRSGPAKTQVIISE
jgi:lipoprotein-anchoring transpeptidase ErfK/SrfK